MSSLHQITKGEVDRYTTGKRTPSCQLLLAWTGEEHEKPSDLFHQICLIGAKGPQSFITIESNLQQHSKGTTLGSLLSVSRTWTNTSLYPQQLLQLLQSPIQVEKRHTLVRIILSLLYIINMKNWGWVLAQRKCLSGWFNYLCACTIACCWPLDLFQQLTCIITLLTLCSPHSQASAHCCKIKLGLRSGKWSIAVIYISLGNVCFQTYFHSHICSPIIKIA